MATMLEAGNAVHAQRARVRAAFRARPASGGARHGAAWSLAAHTLLIAALTPIAPLTALAVVDFVDRGGAPAMLAWVCAAGGLAVAFELMLRRERAALAADAGVRMVAALARAWFQSLLSRDARAPAAQHLAQFRTLRRLRRLTTGAVVTALLDAPFVLALWIAVFVFFGPMGFGPLVALLLQAGAALLLHPYARRRAVHAKRARERLQAALAESAAKRATLEEIGMTQPWAARVEMLATEAAQRRRREADSDAAVDAVSAAIAGVATVVALWIGAAMVMGGDIGPGAAVAGTLLAWRCLAPMDVLARALPDLMTAANTLRSMRVNQATPATVAHFAPHRVEGRVVLRGLVVASDKGGAPALRGVSLDVEPGEIVAICGSSGAGKSALLNAVLGLAQAQSGAVLVDGRDLRSVDPTAHRAQIAWAPQQTTLFHGSVAQNMRLLAPGADAGAIAAALAQAGLALPHPQLPQGLETRLMSGGGGQIDESLRAKIVLAGLYAKNARLLLLDDPGAFLDRDGDKAFLETLASLRGRATVLLATNRPSHMRACDRIVRLEHGMIVSDGATKAVLG